METYPRGNIPNEYMLKKRRVSDPEFSLVPSTTTRTVHRASSNRNLYGRSRTSVYTGIDPIKNANSAVIPKRNFELVNRQVNPGGQGITSTYAPVKPPSFLNKVKGFFGFGTKGGRRRASRRRNTRRNRRSSRR